MKMSNEIVCEYVRSPSLNKRTRHRHSNGKQYQVCFNNKAANIHTPQLQYMYTNSRVLCKYVMCVQGQVNTQQMKNTKWVVHFS